VNKIHFIIEQIEEKNPFMQICYFSNDTLQKLEPNTNWAPMKRLLMDSDLKHFIYVVEVDEKWEYIRFPLPTWSKLDEVISNDQDLYLILSRTPDGSIHKSLLLSEFSKEGKELIFNMKENANYGEEMAGIIEANFPKTIQQLPA
jgi:hypothetical protein